jgi:hypothetical protein
MALLTDRGAFQALLRDCLIDVVRPDISVWGFRGDADYDRRP